MLLYGITIIPMDEELWDSYPTLLAPLCVDDTSFCGLEIWSDIMVRLLLERGADWGYFPGLGKELFIADSPAQEEAMRWAYEAEGFTLQFFLGSIYLRPI